MTNSEIHISGRHRIAALLIAVIAGAFVFSWTWDLASRDTAYHQSHIFDEAVIAMKFGILPAAIVGVRLLRGTRLDIYRFLFAGAVAAFIPILISIASVVFIG